MNNENNTPEILRVILTKDIVHCDGTRFQTYMRLADRKKKFFVIVMISCWRCFTFSCLIMILENTLKISCGCLPWKIKK